MKTCPLQKAALLVVLLSSLLLAACSDMKPKDTRRRIEVHKSSRELTYFDGEGHSQKYRAALGFQPRGHKAVEGDGTTPEGEYYVCVKNPKSNFFLSLGISYPGPRDAERGLMQGLISQEEHDAILKAHEEKGTPPWKTALGGEVFIHGRGAAEDWTAGCVALEDPDMQELFDRAEVGIPVVILP